METVLCESMKRSWQLCLQAAIWGLFNTPRGIPTGVTLPGSCSPQLPLTFFRCSGKRDFLQATSLHQDPTFLVFFPSLLCLRSCLTKQIMIMLWICIAKAQSFAQGHLTADPPDCASLSQMSLGFCNVLTSGRRGNGTTVSRDVQDWWEARHVHKELLPYRHSTNPTETWFVSLEMETLWGEPR